MPYEPPNPNSSSLIDELDCCRLIPSPSPSFLSFPLKRLLRENLRFVYQEACERVRMCACVRVRVCACDFELKERDRDDLHRLKQQNHMLWYVCQVMVVHG